ncbi:MAG: HEAT repeat domain-containing protein [Verrucomicrobia bacterium]|nr:HEAT repeat domain-containing protein [Verrucomicrobiota bacterium]
MKKSPAASVQVRMIFRTLPRLWKFNVLLTLFPAVGSLGLAQAAPLGFDDAKWIWFSREPMPISQSFPGGVNFFRAAFTVPAGVPIKSAEMIVTADNLFSFHLNGKLAGEGHPDPNAWSQPKRFDVAGLLAPGRNVLAVEAVNTVPGPAGLIVKLIVNAADGQMVTLVSDENWKCSDNEVPNWTEPGFDDKRWPAAHVIGTFGVGPWGRVAVRAALERAGRPLDNARQAVRQALEDHKDTARRGGIPGPRFVELTPPADYPWPDAVAFVSEDCSLYRPTILTGTSYDSLNVTIFNPRHSRSFPEHDLPAPMKVGHKLLALKPARPGVQPRVLCDAGAGAIGSPSVSFDGRWIYVSMVTEGESFFHIHRLPAEGGKPQRLTDGPFHDIDPAELPDGRIVFTSTRIGTFEEYHNPPSRSLFVMQADGRDIRPLTYTFIFDNEPEVLADGRILFIRSDNFFDRGKVETLLHAVHPDGTEGYTEFGLDIGPDYGGRLRAFNVGSPAPMPDGRVAYVGGSGIELGRPGCAAREMQHLRVEAGDVAALPDGRLLCTVPRVTPVIKTVRRKTRIVPDYTYEKLGLVDPQGRRDGAVILFDSTDEPIHSPVYLGPRMLPPVLAEKVSPRQADDVRATGILFCQDARFTKNTTAGWPHVRAIRVLAGKGLMVRSSHSYIVHAGSDVTELGTVPLAPDGSFAVEVPADTAIAFQAVDAEGRSELNEMSWIYVRPGETRGCVGCHQPRQVSPPAARPEMQALRSRPLRLLGQGQPHRFRGNNAAVTGQMELQFDRYREVAGLNRHSETEASLATGAEEVTALIQELKGRDEGKRISAAQRLSIFRDLRAAGALAAALRDGSREVRVASALALATCGGRESVTPLLASLSDAEPLVAQAAVVALENLTGHAEAFEAFGAASERAPQAKAWDDWFHKTSWDRIEHELVLRLQNTDRDVVRRAAVALGRIGGNAARTALREYVARQRIHNPFPEWRKDHGHRGDGARFNSLAAVNPRTLQAAVRALGYLKDAAAVPLLTEIIRGNLDPETANLFLTEAAVESLGRIATPDAEAALTNTFVAFREYLDYTRWYGDHDALIACHASPPHYFVIEALDAMASTRGAGLVAHLIRAVPTDPDRALFPHNDDYETLTGRVLRHAGAESAVVETCLSILGDTQAKRSAEIQKAIATTHQAWGGKPDPENRAAQILSLTCRDPKCEPRLRAAFDRYRAKSNDIPRVFDTGIPVVTQLPVKHWVCFFLARALGNLRQPQSVDSLLAALTQSPPESALGHPDPLGPGVLFLHNDLTPCWRAAAAWALGRVGDRRAGPALLQVVADLRNAPDTRHAAAEALGQLGDPASAREIRSLAAKYPEVATRKTLLQSAERLAW